MTIDQPGDVIALVNSSSATELFVSVVSDFELFTKLADREATSIAEVSDLLEIDGRAADVSLTYLAALGLLERLPGGSVRLTQAAQACLTDGAEFDVRAYATAQKERPGVRDATQVLRTG